MSLRTENILQHQRRTAFVAALLAAGFAVANPVPAWAAATWTVTNCSDGIGLDGNPPPGSLRAAIASAASNDIIDMTGLTCGHLGVLNSTITISQNTLTLNGPGMGNLTIGCVYAFIGCQAPLHRIFNHTNIGALLINDLSINDGAVYNTSGSALGGCIYSAGTVALKHVKVSACRAHSDSAAAEGGAIYAKGGLSMQYSTLSSNRADSGTGNAYGGAVRTDGSFSSKYSTISDNNVSGTFALGGGVYLGGNVSITSSTISGNSANAFAGIDIFSATPASRTTTITNSTISGNTASGFGGGLFVNSGTVNIRNSTIAMNTATVGHFGINDYAPGMSTSGAFGSMAVTLQSTLIANNTYGSLESDLSKAKTSTHSITIGGNNNLVGTTTVVVPTDTIRNSCPLLGPLRDNGRQTKTHALLSRSPAIDSGNNIATLHEDQRGGLADTSPYPFPRVSGLAADIGAYEVQQGDIIFNTAFDGCPVLL